MSLLGFGFVGLPTQPTEVYYRRSSRSIDANQAINEHHFYFTK